MASRSRCQPTLPSLKVVRRQTSPPRGAPGDAVTLEPRSSSAGSKDSGNWNGALSGCGQEEVMVTCCHTLAASSMMGSMCTSVVEELCWAGECAICSRIGHVVQGPLSSRWSFVACLSRCTRQMRDHRHLRTHNQRPSYLPESLTPMNHCM